MYLAELTASLRRRWYLLVVGLAFTVMGALAMTRMVAPNYEAHASVLLIPPANTTTATGNPYLFLGGLSQAMDVLVRAMNADTARAPIQEAFPGVTFSNERDGTTSSPILIISAVGSDPAPTMKTMAAVMDSVPQELVNLQQPLAVPAGATISSMVLAADTTPTMDRKAQTRALVSVTAVGLVATVLLTGFIDKVVINRRSRRLSSTATTSGDNDPTEPYLTRTITVPALESGRTAAGTPKSARWGNRRRRTTGPPTEMCRTRPSVSDTRRGRHSHSAAPSPSSKATSNSGLRLGRAVLKGKAQSLSTGWSCGRVHGRTRSPS